MIQQIARYLSSKQGLGTYGDAPGGSIFYGYLPDQPDQALCVYQTGESSDHKNGDAELRVQILLRGNKQVDSARLPALRVAALLDGFSGYFVDDGDPVILCTRENGPVGLGPDQNGRQEYSINLRVHYQFRAQNQYRERW